MIDIISSLLINTVYGLLLIAVGICLGVVPGLAFYYSHKRDQHQAMLDRKAKAKGRAAA